MNSSGIVQTLWNYRNVLRDHGISYGDYVEQLTGFFYGSEWPEEIKTESAFEDYLLL